MLLTLCIGTAFSGLGHSLSSVGVSLDSKIALHLYIPTILDIIIIDIKSLLTRVKLQARVAAIFVFVSFCSLLSIARVPALMKEIKVVFLTLFRLYNTIDNA